MSERILVNFFYAPPVGHAVEALHYCLGHHRAIPVASVSVALNSATAYELGSLCPFIEEVYAIDHPFVQPRGAAEPRLDALPRDWHWVLDDFRRRQDFQLDAFPGMRDYYEASDHHLRATRGRALVGARPPGYQPRSQLLLALPDDARTRARRRLTPTGEQPEGGPCIAIMVAGSSDPSLYPSVRSWRLILDALSQELSGLRIALIGKLRADQRTRTALAPAHLRELLNHATAPIDCFDLDLIEQLAIVEACSLFLSPHTGFGLAALAVGTPWLTLSGGRWFEYYFNHVPFRSIIPDVTRYPAFTQGTAPPIVQDEDGMRTPSMTRQRIRDDLDAIVAAAKELTAGKLTYEQALSDYFAALLAAHGGDPARIWSIDGVHLDHMPAS